MSRRVRAAVTERPADIGALVEIVSGAQFEAMADPWVAQLAATLLSMRAGEVGRIEVAKTHVSKGWLLDRVKAAAKQAGVKIRFRKSKVPEDNARWVQFERL